MCSCSSKPVNSSGLVACHITAGVMPRHTTAVLRAALVSCGRVRTHSALPNAIAKAPTDTTSPMPSLPRNASSTAPT